jgi:serine/threonine-protein kinase HipA
VTRMASLIVWMNGSRVGEWGTTRSGISFFKYDESWADSRLARPLSLSLPLTADLEVRGARVNDYFDNLLPDNPAIRNRIRTRFRAASDDAFDLLTAVGRDCVGAVQLLPPDEEPLGWDRIDAVRLNNSQVEQLLTQVTATTPLNSEEQDELRISIPGAQEKTALLGMSGAWFRPRHATPTTHILKLPLGIIGGFRGDFSDSVENEWLCGRFLAELGLPVAESAIATFGDQKALVVTRFDRRWIGASEPDTQKRRFRPPDGIWIARLPQEDFCQATGRPQTQKYEADGGPSIQESLGLLANSEDPTADQTHFLLAQLTYWLLAATDGHAKNFSLSIAVGGNYRMTPLYDVLSAWPVIGHGKNQLALQKAKLAMAIRGSRAHHRLNEIVGRHWQNLAARSGLPGLWHDMHVLIEAAPRAIDRLEQSLPSTFPEHVYTTIRAGVHAQTCRFKQTLASSEI